MAESKIKKIQRILSLNLKYYANTLIVKNDCRQDGVTCVIFSRNRAFQLDALLKSIKRYSETTFDIIVQYSCSDLHRSSYIVLLERYKDVKFVEESNFKDTLLKQLKEIKTKWMFYLVDDQAFIRHFNIIKILALKQKHNIISLRLGDNITNFGIEDKEFVPRFTYDNEYLMWRWRENGGNYDWCYQFSVDATIYDTIDVVRGSLAIPFKAPNSYEANMNSLLLYKSNNVGISFRKPVVVNLIINASRGEMNYESCVSGEYTAEDMLVLLQEGKELDLDKISAINYKSSHHIIQNIRDVLK